MRPRSPLRRLPGFVALAVLLGACSEDAPTGSGSAPDVQRQVTGRQQCELVDTSTEEAIPGVTLTWTSSFRCANAPDAGTYQIEVTVENSASSDEAVTINDLILRGATPRPRGRGPDATATASGLPLTIDAGESGSFSVSGTYELVRTDEGKKANVHLSALGEGASSGLEFELGINVLLRAPGATE